MHLMVYHFVSQKAIAKVSRSGSNIIDCDFKNDHLPTVGMLMFTPDDAIVFHYGLLFSHANITHNNPCSITMSKMDKTQEIVFEISIN